MSCFQRFLNALVQDDPYPESLSHLDRMDSRQPGPPPPLEQHDEPATPC